MLIYLSLIESEEDKSKFIFLYENYRSSMFYVANEILHNRQDAEDVVHQTFVKIAETIETVDISIPSRSKSLLLTITRHNAIDLYRKKQRCSVYDTTILADTVVGLENLGVVGYCFTKLPENYRTVLALWHSYGYSHKEIARLLSLRESNVAKIHQRAKAKLEKLCREEGIL